MRETHNRLSVQQLVTRRFGMAAGTYALALLLTWISVAWGFYQAPLSTAFIGSLMIVASQLGFFWVFRRGYNLRFRDPALTELQVLVALIWLTYFLFHFGSNRGSLLLAYVLVLMFAIFLAPKVFVRYAVLAFASFAGMTLLDDPRERSEVALLQCGVLLVTLVWMCLFVMYVDGLRQRMRQRRFALQAHQQTLRGMMRQLEELASTDELTGLYNRRYFLQWAERELSRLRPGHQCGLVLIDLDHFKRINDVHGHAAGDRVLQTFARVARSCLRDGDVLARYGGEEFVLLLPNTTADQLWGCAERLRLAFAENAQQESPAPLGLSAGLTMLSAGDDLEAALQCADEALYRAKEKGRNCCVASWQQHDVVC